MVKTHEILVVTPNFKRRLSGVTSTIIQLVPIQNQLGLGVAAVGEGLPAWIPRLRYTQLPKLLLRPRQAQHRVWHARRNVEMIGGLILRHVFRAPLKLLFTSASQREHKRLTKWLIRRMDAVVATSRKTAAYLDVPRTVVMHGIDTDRFCPAENAQDVKRSLGLDPDKKIAGCFGRIRHQKGTDLFVKSMIDLLPDRPDWIGIVAGRTTQSHQRYEAQLREQIAVAGLTDRILFVGEHTDIERWYQALSLFVAPQRWEGFGLTPLEAMACGVPVVAADVGAFSELIVNEQTGKVVPRDDHHAISRTAAALMDDDSLRQQTGQAALDHVRKNFPLSREAEDLISIYRALIVDASPSSG